MISLRLAPEPVTPGMRVGLYGGSFNPPHAGHVHVARTALARLGLDRVWVLVSPQNPLKASAHTAPYRERLAAARRMLARPRVLVSDLEACLGARFTVQTLRALRGRYPGVRFVLVMGADSFATLHRWRDWRTVAALAPIGVVARPGWNLRAGLGRAARALPRRAPNALSGTPAPGWSFVSAPLRMESSSAIRAR